MHVQNVIPQVKECPQTTTIVVRTAVISQVVADNLLGIRWTRGLLSGKMHLSGMPFCAHSLLRLRRLRDFGVFLWPRTTANQVISTVDQSRSLVCMLKHALDQVAIQTIYTSRGANNRVVQCDWAGRSPQPGEPRL